MWMRLHSALAGGTCYPVSQRCSGTILDDAMGRDVGCGCLFLIFQVERGVGECHLSGLPSYSETQRQPPVEVSTLSMVSEQTLNETPWEDTQWDNPTHE